MQGDADVARLLQNGVIQPNGSTAIHRLIAAGAGVTAARLQGPGALNPVQVLFICLQNAKL